MELQNLEESVRGFQPPYYGRVKRTGETYVATENFTRKVITIGVKLYSKIERLDQTARLIRDLIEWALRRYHGYAIKEDTGSHYRDASIKPHERNGLIFEHVIPVRYIIALLLQNRITVEQAMNPPTCTLRKKDDKLLERLGLGDTTPDVFNFWERYQSLNIDIVTYSGEPIDQSSWNLSDHYQRFLKQN